MNSNASISNVALSGYKKLKNAIFCSSVSLMLLSAMLVSQSAIAGNNLSVHGHELSLAEYKILVEAHTVFLASGNAFSNYSAVFLDRKKDRYVITFLSKFHEPDVFGVRPGLPPDIIIVKKDDQADLKIVPGD